MSIDGPKWSFDEQGAYRIEVLPSRVADWRPLAVSWYRDMPRQAALAKCPTIWPHWTFRLVEDARVPRVVVSV